MNRRLVVVGTDTGIGKTTFAAGLTGALDGAYWKPVQSGDLDATDSDAVQRLAGLDPRQIIPEVYRLKTPASPHLSAEIDGIEIDPAALVLPRTDRPLVVEGAGGLLVPLTREVTYLA
jgi:dethiobiotin synthetase